MAKSGLKVGDILVGMHRWETLSLTDVVFVLDHPDKASFGAIKFYILRDGRVHSGRIQPAD